MKEGRIKKGTSKERNRDEQDGSNYLLEPVREYALCASFDYFHNSRLAT